MSYSKSKAITLAATLLLAALELQAGTVAVNASIVKQKIIGFGAATKAGKLGVDPAWYDLLFSETSGIGLNILRMSVPEVLNADPAPNQVGHFNEARKRNPNMICIACPWSPPAEYKTNGNINNGGELKTSSYQDYANMLADFVIKLKSQGIDLYALSVQNEPDNTTSYASCIWNGTQYLNFTRDYLKPAFKAKNVTAKIMLGDCGSWYESFVIPTLNDPVGVNAVDIVSAHAYWTPNPPPFTLTKAKGKEVWQTEVCRMSGNDPSMVDGVYWAESIFKYMNDIEASAWLYWCFVNHIGDYGIITGGTATVPTVINRRYYTIGNYSKFIKQGYYRIETTPARQSDALVTAYKDPNSGKFVIVAVNKNSSSVSMTFNLDFAATSVTPYLTTQSDNLAAMSSVAITNRSFSATLPAMSVTSFVGNANALAVHYRSMGRTCVLTPAKATYDVRGCRIGATIRRNSLGIGVSDNGRIGAKILFK